MCSIHECRRQSEGGPADLCDRHLARFHELAVGSPGECWEWRGAVNSEGYGRLNLAYAHRIAYQLHVGPIASGLHIDHLCRNRACVNPAHLEAVPQRVNTLRGMSPGAQVARANRCQRGHDFTPENTYLRPDGDGRQCRECIRIRTRRQTAKQKTERDDNGGSE